MLSFRKFLMETQFIQLKHVDLTKRGGARVGVFLQKIKDGDAFTTKKGAVVLDKDQYKELEARMYEKGFSATLSGKMGSRLIQVKYPQDFLKVPEFGGKGAGAGVAAENAELKLFMRKMDDVFEKEGERLINLRIGGRTVKCTGIISTPNPGGRDPKADFSIVGEDGKTQVAWISHKAGRTASDFQQYGGLSDTIFRSDKEVKDFMNDVKKQAPDGLQRGQSFMRVAEDPKLINRSIYGTEYGRARGINNVDEFHQGNMELRKSGNYYTIRSTHMGKNGDKLTGEYAPILYIRYDARPANAGGVQVKNGRVGVFPRKKAASTAKEI